MYQRLGVDDNGANLDLSNQIIQGTANAVYKFKTAEDQPDSGPTSSAVSASTTSRPWGTTRISSATTTPPPTSASTLGAGFDFKVSSIGAFVEGRFHDVFTEGDDVRFLPITVGIRLGGS